MPEARYAREFNAKADKRGFDSLTQVTVEPVEEPKPSSPEEAIEWANGSAYLDSLIEDAWELLREECDEALKINPNDENAQKRLLQCDQHDRQKKTSDPAGLKLVIAKKTKVRLSERRVGVWKRTSSHGWVIHVTRSKVGDVIEVRKAKGLVEKVQLVGEVAPNFYKAVNVSAEKEREIASWKY